MSSYNNILLLKLPSWTHPDSIVSDNDDDFRTKLTFRPYPSLALACLCGFIDKYKKLDYHITAYDLNIDAYTKPEEPVDTSLFMDLLINKITNNEYDILALSATYVYNLRWVETAVTLSRKLKPTAKIIVGGGYPTLFPDKCIQEHNIDDVVSGEGDDTFLHLLNRYNNFVDKEFSEKFPFSGYASKDENGNIYTVKREHKIDMTDLPVPAWHYLDIENYFKNSGDATLPIEGSRGCPYRCSYCCTRTSWGNVVRYKKIPQFLDEIQAVQERYNATLHLVDDNLAFSKEWMTTFLKHLIQRGMEKRFDASNFSILHLHEEVIDLLAQAGLDRFSIAVESGSKKTQRRIKKFLNFDRVKRVVKMIKDKNLRVHVCWMLGFPEENRADMEETFNLARDLGGHTNQFLVVTPYPGTPLYEDAKKSGSLIFDDDNIDRFDNFKSEFIKSDDWTYPELRDWIYDANIEMNFLDNPFYETENSRDTHIDYLEKLNVRLPGHIISNVVLGYLYSLKGEKDKRNKLYGKAIKLLKQPELSQTFGKYFKWNYSAIHDFNEYRGIISFETRKAPTKLSRSNAVC